MTNEFFMYLYGTLFKTIKYRISGLDIHMCTFHKPISITMTLPHDLSYDIYIHNHVRNIL